jgi:hypothetical protein
LDLNERNLQNKKKTDPEELATLCILIFGDYSTGLASDDLVNLRKSLDTFRKIQQKFLDYFSDCHPRLTDGSDLGYDHRVLYTVKTKVRGVLLCVIPSTDSKIIEDLKREYSLVILELYNPNDSRFPQLKNFSKKRYYAVGLALYKLHGDIFLNMDTGTTLSDDEIQRLFNITLQYYQPEPKQSSVFKGKGYELSGKPE